MAQTRWLVETWGGRGCSGPQGKAQASGEADLQGTEGWEAAASAELQGALVLPSRARGLPARCLLGEEAGPQGAC